MRTNNLESYLVLILEIEGTKYTYTIAKSNKDLANILNAMTPEHMIVSITPLAHLKDSSEVLTKLRGKQKPTNLEFGKE